MKPREMVRILLVGFALVCGAALTPLVSSAQAQFGNIFGNNPPRPPGAVPGGERPQDSDEEEVPDLPQQGRVLPTPNRPQPGMAVPPPGSVQTQPLPPPPGTTVIPQQPPATATAPGQPPGVASAPNPLPGLPQGQRQPKNAPPAPATLQPGDEVVTEPPAQKIANKQAVFSGLDKITGRIIKFDVDIAETVQFGALRVKPQACYTRPATEAANTDAFVEVEEITLQGEVKKIFSGWMFATSPGLHGVEHPIYDVWLTDCKGAAAPVASAQPDPPPRPSPPQKRQPAKQPARPPPQPAPLPGFR